MRKNVQKIGTRARRVLLTLLFFVAFFAFSLPVQAEENAPVWETVPEELGQVSDVLPDEVRESLDDGLFSEDVVRVGESLGETLRPQNVFSMIAEQSALGLKDALRLLAQLCGLLLLAAVFGRVQASIGSEALSGAVRFCTGTAIFSAIIYLQLEDVRRIAAFFEGLSSLMGATVPALGTVWAMGGNLSTATAGTGTLYVFLAVCEAFFANSVTPIVCFCTALALCNTLAPEMGLRGLASSVKKIYTFVLGMIMTLLLAILGAQTTLTAAADTTTARAAKLVSSTVIPIVGGSVGESLRTVGAGVQYLKSVVGVSGILFLVALLLPTLISLILTRLVFLLGVGIADLLGCENESRLLGELGGIYGCMIAVVAMSSVMFVFAMVIFIKSVVAVG